MSCMVSRRTFHTAPEQGQGRIGYVPIFQVLKLFQVVSFNCISIAFRCPVPVPDTASVNGFYIISVPVPVPAPETASVRTPLGPAYTKLRQLSDDASNPVLIGNNKVCSRMRLLHIFQGLHCFQREEFR